MRNYYFVLLLVCLFIQSSIQINSEPIFEVDLDLPHVERWKPLISAKLSELVDFVKYYNSYVKVTPEQKQLFVTYGNSFPEYGKNIDAISELTGLTLEELYTYNFMYDIENMGCTSIIVRQPDNTIFHARNLDYLFTEKFSKLAVEIHWKKNGQIVYKSESLVGFISLITVSKIGQFSISINYRSNKSRDESIDALINKHYNQGIYLTWKVLENANNYQEAVEILTTENVSSPIYYIVSGISGNEGTIIERNRVGHDNIYNLSEQSWYLVQTNTDQSKYKDSRLKATQKILETLGQEGATQERILTSVLNQPSIKTKLTISSSVYSAFTGDFETQNYYLN